MLWALATGAVTGGAWVAIVLLRRQRGDADAAPRELAEMRARLEELEQGQARLAEVEQRLDFAERLLVERSLVERSLVERREAERLRPPEP